MDQIEKRARIYSLGSGLMKAILFGAIGMAVIDNLTTTKLIVGSIVALIAGLGAEVSTYLTNINCHKKLKNALGPAYLDELEKEIEATGLARMLQTIWFVRRWRKENQQAGD